MPDREITEEEWIAASQACCGADADDGDAAHKTDGGDSPAPPSSNAHAPPPDR
jgi:hypothetical protein